MIEHSDPNKPQYYEFYNEEGYPAEPKRIFVEIANMIEAAQAPSGKRFLDIGCANGAFTAYLRARFPDNEFFGVDIFDEMLDMCRHSIPDATFENASILDLPEGYIGKFDVVTCVGVLMMFDEITIHSAIENLVRSIGAGGKVLAMSIFSENGVDTITRWRHRMDGKPSGWTIDRNIFSLQSVGEILDTIGITYKFHKFDIDIDLPKTNDPRRAYTVQLNDNPRQQINGLNQLTDMYILEIAKH